MGRNALILVVVGLCTVTNPAFSREDEDLEMELFFAPAETVSSATRHVQPLDESPSAVTVITREDIESSGARSLPEVLRLVPNMDINLIKPMWYEVGVRGGTTDSADTMLLLVDGRDATLELFGFPIWPFYPASLDVVERIEVIRGPGSALYGANAYSGVVHVITRPPGEGPRATVSIRGGETGLSELNCSADGQLGPLALTAVAGRRQSNLWTSRTVGQEVTRGQLRGKLELGEAASLLLDVGTFFGSGDVHTGLGDVNIQDVMDAYVMARLNYQDLEVQVAYSRLDFYLDFGLELYEKNMGVSLARLPPSNAGGNKINVLARHALEVFHNRITLGAEYAYNHAFGDILVPTDHREHRYGFYFQDEVKLSEILEETWQMSIPALLLTVGLRFDGNTLTEWELSPRASLVFMPGESHSIRLGYAHAFLKPTFFESSVRLSLEDPIDPTLSELSLANPDLKNQTIDSLELGYSVNFLDQRLVLRLDLSYNRYDNQIWFQIDPSRMEYIEVVGMRIPKLSGPGIDFVNMENLYTGHTVELEVIARPTERSRIFANAGYRQMFDTETGEFSIAEPVWRLGFGADLMGASGWSVSFRGYYKSSHHRYLPDPESFLESSIPVRLPAQLLLNVRIAWKLVARPFDLSAGIEAYNLLDQRVRQFAGQSFANEPDHSGERMDRRIVLFLQGQLD
jgi:iron complex outermembrane receptor protein